MEWYLVLLWNYGSENPPQAFFRKTQLEAQTLANEFQQWHDNVVRVVDIRAIPAEGLFEGQESS